MNPETTAFSAEAWGATRTWRGSPGTASPNWNALASRMMVNPAVMADAITAMNFTLCWAAGVEPTQYPAFRSVMNCPDAHRATQTMPAKAITKNMPVVPESPNFSSTAAETITVSNVIPLAGLLAVVAMVLAATVVKKNEPATSVLGLIQPQSR